MPRYSKQNITGELCLEIEIWWSGEVREWLRPEKGKKPHSVDLGVATESPVKQKFNTGTVYFQM